MGAYGLGENSESGEKFIDVCAWLCNQIDHSCVSKEFRRLL